MLSLRLVVVLVVAGLALAERLPTKISVNNYGSMSCVGTRVSPNTILIPGMCLMSYSQMDVKIRGSDIPSNDSGNIYRITRILYHNDRDMSTMSHDYALARLDRDMVVENDVPTIPNEDVPVSEGDICTTLRRDLDSQSMYMFSELEHYNVKVISDAKCQELFPETFTDDFICVGAVDPQAENYEDQQCQGETGAPLVCNGDIVAINSCEVSCYGEACAYKKISALGDFVQGQAL
ncbi:trypsin I-P1-like [Phlebotomus papatasi]|uniref:trypsin I-P1-like n=1 Tax=Phlebotomus papatasi TaxID=29031 RepID=UPI0024840739|nr:trypsin I-P1-like [Phlebotomus papatasi]